jgi:biopolymer transport protein ExbD
MSRRTHGRRLGLNAEINVVSLIDVILLLLLIFMITAPMMTSGIEMRLPTGEVRPLESNEAVMVEMSNDGKILVDGKAWSRARLDSDIRGYLRGREEVTLRADRRLTHGETFDVMALLTSAGATKLSVVGEVGSGG